MSDTQEQTPVVLPDTEVVQDNTEQVVDQTPQELTPNEERAMRDGWVPKDQWKGDPDDWRPAKEFNERGEFFNHIKEQKKRIDELQRATVFLTEQSKRQYMQGFKEAIDQLRARRDAALADGDSLQAARIGDQIDDVKERAKVAAATVVQPTVEGPTETEVYKAWHRQNPWYKQDRALTRLAEALGAEYHSANPSSSEQDMLEYVAKELKRDYPDKFGRVRGAPSPDGSGRETGGARQPSNKFASVEAAMTEEQKGIMKTILKTTSLTKEEYLKQFAA